MHSAPPPSFLTPTTAAGLGLYKIDFDLLDALDRHGRNVVLTLAAHNDADRGYLNQRLRTLYHYAFTTRIGSAERAALYEITKTERAFLEHRHLHDPRMTLDEFQTAIANATGS